MTASTARCPTCQKLRPLDASYCPSCGTAFTGRRPPTPAAATDPWQPSSRHNVRVDVSVWTAVKAGAGFILGASLMALLVWLVLLVLFAVGVSTALR